MDDFPGRNEIVKGVSTVLGPAGRELGELVADRGRFWRWRCAVTIMKRAAELKRDMNRQEIDVPLKFFLPFLEEASKESDDELIELWATLLASADQTTTGFDLISVEILRKIGGSETSLLLALSKANDPVRTRIDDLFSGPILYDSEGMSVDSFDIIESKMAQHSLFPITFEHINVSIDSNFLNENRRSIIALKKLGLVKEITQRERVRGFDDHETDLVARYLVLSELGGHLIQRCSGGGAPHILHIPSLPFSRINGIMARGDEVHLLFQPVFKIEYR